MADGDEALRLSVERHRSEVEGLEKRRQEVERDLQDARAQRAELASELERLDARRSELEKVENDLGQRTRDLEARARELGAAEGDLDRERAAFAKEREAARVAYSATTHTPSPANNTRRDRSDRKLGMVPHHDIQRGQR